ncbi:MAG: RluA family pseudouridine synthase [Nitrospirae bacterium]|nr:RluA family pseudouridine synthase [Nitrospirota bacterium]MCL5978018.1 RluA family pseudouridine synthase [Nitrospirota bacterium]
MKSFIINVLPPDASKRLDVFVSEKTDITRSQVQRLIRERLVLVNNKQESPNYRIRTNDSITINKPEEEFKTLIPENIPLKIFHIDDHLVVVDKPAGMVVYPATGHDRGTLLNALAYRCKKLASIGGPLRPGVVHRLDKDTSGIMVVALDDKTYYDLAEQFKNRTINRKYMALVYGNIKEDSGKIVMEIGRSASDRKKMSTKTKRGKEAVTRWKVIKKFGAATLIEAKLGTGRTHQIRVHFSAIGHPVLGDKTYGKKIEVEIKTDGSKKKIAFPRQMLHAETLGFTHPVTKEYLEFSSPLPEDMEGCIKNLTLSAAP